MDRYRLIGVERGDWSYLPHSPGQGYCNNDGDGAHGGGIMRFDYAWVFRWWRKSGYSPQKRRVSFWFNKELPISTREFLFVLEILLDSLSWGRFLLLGFHNLSKTLGSLFSVLDLSSRLSKLKTQRVAIVVVSFTRSSEVTHLTNQLFTTKNGSKTFKKEVIVSFRTGELNPGLRQILNEKPKC